MVGSMLGKRYTTGIFQRALHLSCCKRRISENTNNNSSSFPELHAKIATCGELYEKWRKENRYWKVPGGSLNFDITYIDTSVGNIRKLGHSHKPLVVAVHGAPGSYRDFSSLTSHLHENGLRVVIPNLPDFTVYKPGIFRHSVEEKTQLLKDFFKEINVTEIDMLICHSSSVYPSLKLCIENGLPTVKSLGMFNTGTYNFVRSVRPYGAMRAMVKLSEFSIGLKFLEFCGTYLMKHVNAVVRLDNLMDPLLSLTTMCYADFQQSKRNFEIVSSQKLPVLYAFAENDKLIEKHFSYDVAYLLGANDSTIFHYDENGELLHTGIDNPLLKVMAFEKGSHYVFKKHSDIINEAVMSFILKIIKKQQ